MEKSGKPIAFHIRPMLGLAAGGAFAVLSGCLLPDWALFFAAGLFLLLGIKVPAHRLTWKIGLLFAALLFVRLSFVPTESVPGGRYTVQGIITETPTAYRDGTKVELRRVTLNGERMEGHLVFVLEGDGFLYGDELLFEAEVQPREDWKQARYEGILASGTGVGSVTVLSHRSDPYGWLLAVRERLKGNLDALFLDQAGAIKGILLGDRSDLAWEQTEQFRAHGVLHLFAVSGLHVTVLAGVVLYAIQGQGHWKRILWQGVFLLFYAALTDFTPSVLRAAFTVLALQAVQYSRRKEDAPSAWLFSFGCVLLVSPYALFEIGFQLSYAAMAGILLLAPPIRKRMPLFRGKLFSVLLSAFCAQLGILPLLAYRFTSVAWAAVPFSVLLMPFLGLLLVLSFLGMFVYVVSPALAWAITRIPYYLLEYLEFITSTPTVQAWCIPSPCALAVLLWYFGMLFCSQLYLKNSRHPPWIGMGLFGASLLLWIFV